jgi:hypothetical protein
MTRCTSISATGFNLLWGRFITCGPISNRPRPLILVLVLSLAAPLVAAGPDVPLPSLLDRTGHQVESFWNYFPAVTCTEQLRQVKLGDSGKVLFERRSAYDYLVLLDAAGSGISVDESRVEKNEKGSKGSASLLLTGGFAILSFVLHPIYQHSYEFQEAGDEMLDGRRTIRLEFRAIDGERSPSVLRLRGRDYPLEWKGTAWIDADSFAVVRIRAELGTSMEEIGLLRLNADVTYSSVHFAGDTSWWLPARAVIEAATRRQHWRNEHVFTEYRRFNVETESKGTAVR